MSANPEAKLNIFIEVKLRFLPKRPKHSMASGMGMGWDQNLWKFFYFLAAANSVPNFS